MHTDKQSEDEVVIERAVKTTIQILYDIRLFNQFDNAGEMKDFSFTE